MRAVHITRFGCPEVLDIVDLPDPTPSEGQKLYEVSSVGVNFADTHHPVPREVHQPRQYPRPSSPQDSRPDPHRSHRRGGSVHPSDTRPREGLRGGGPGALSSRGPVTPHATGVQVHPPRRGRKGWPAARPEWSSRRPGYQLTGVHGESGAGRRVTARPSRRTTAAACAPALRRPVPARTGCGRTRLRRA
jgi:hypothetical protein